MRSRLSITFAIAALSAPAFAHHSFAMFDLTKDVTLKGTVTEFKWTNPHSWMHVDVVEAGGAKTNWAIEMTSPNNLVLRGWRRSSLKPGDQVTVVFHPLRNGRKGGALATVTLADGTVLENR